ncbi:HTH-type transcriptional regulator CdhR [Klebsiella oxytoca]|nr:HTH-type transcriptional regulator CdhR [Klebsiella oxytoca]
MKKILIIVPDGGMLFESAGIADILMQANRLHPEGASEICYQVRLATTQPHQVIHGQSGLNLLADHRLHEIDPREPLDTIIITGRGQNPQEGIAVVDWLRLAAPHARRIASICGGAMLLAQTGLLDGRRATTHWKLLETMQAEFPLVRVEGGPLYIQDEHIWTSGGVSSGFDLTLALVEEDYGFSLARDIAQDFVMYLRRPGGQLQFSRYNLRQTTTLGPINDLLAWLLENLTADLSVDKLAEKVAMSREISPACLPGKPALRRRVTSRKLVWPLPGSVWSRPATRWSVSPNKRDLAVALTCDGCLKNSFISRPANIASGFTAAEWRKVILFCHLRHQTPGLH